MELGWLVQGHCHSTARNCKSSIPPVGAGDFPCSPVYLLGPRGKPSTREWTSGSNWANSQASQKRGQSQVTWPPSQVYSIFVDHYPNVFAICLQKLVSLISLISNHCTWSIRTFLLFPFPKYARRPPFLVSAGQPTPSTVSGTADICSWKTCWNDQSCHLHRPGASVFKHVASSLSVFFDLDDMNAMSQTHKGKAEVEAIMWVIEAEWTGYSYFSYLVILGRGSMKPEELG